MVRTSGTILQNGDFTGEAGEALVKDRLVTIRSDGLIYHCDAAEIPVGMVPAAYVLGDKEVSVLRLANRRRLGEASAAIAAGAALKPAADGKVAAAALDNVAFEYLVGVAVTAAAADGDKIDIEGLQ